MRRRLSTTVLLSLAVGCAPAASPPPSQPTSPQPSAAVNAAPVGAAASEPSAKNWPDRSVLPIAPYQKVGKLAPILKDSDPITWPKEVEAPEGAPNVVLVMTDDVGFGASSTFGGPVPTPTMDHLAAEGLAFNRFHTTAVCSPSRASVITGRNHHTAATGIIMELSTPYPGYHSLMSKSVATIGEILTDNGYATAWFGKNHNVPDWQTSPAGPFDLWPTGLGFQYFYGFLGADAHQFAPALFENTIAVEPYLGKKDYHLDEDLADHAISWIHNQKSIRPKKPFFMYYTPGTAHAPHHAPKAWLEKFKGKFDYGWDKQRELTFEKQKQLGVIPKNAVLTPIPKDYQAFDALSPGMKKVVCREMEAYAAALSHADYQIGRVLEAINQMGELDNTLVIYIQGDNGSSAEDGTGVGMTSEIATIGNKIPDTEEFMLKHLDEFGGPWMQNHYSHSWAHAMNTPFQWDKKIASHLGGTRNGMVISWPKRIHQRGLRSQFTHITDVVPTILDAANIPAPKTVAGVEQKPMAGTSMVYAFDDANAAERHTTQYFEIIANRAIYDHGWMASTTPKRLPWVSAGKSSEDPVHDYQWELYDLNADFTQSNNLAARFPDKLKELQATFLKEAEKYDVFPLDDRYVERGMPQNRPQPNAGRTSFTYYPGTVRITEGMAPDMKNRSYSIRAKVEIPAGGADGMLMTQGGWFGGTALMLLKHKPTFVYSLSHYPENKWTIQSGSALAPGKHTIAMDFAYAGGGVGKAAVVTLSVDDKVVAKGEVPRTIPVRVSLDETLDFGEDTGTPIIRAYEVPFKFTGKLESVTIDLR